LRERHLFFTDADYQRARLSQAFFDNETAEKVALARAAATERL